MRNFVISFLMSKFSTCKLFLWPKIEFFASKNFIGKMAFMTEHKLKHGYYRLESIISIDFSTLMTPVGTRAYLETPTLVPSVNAPCHCLGFL